MATITREQLEEIADIAGLDADRAIRPTYSGRYMYGRNCVGIVLDRDDNVDLFDVAFAAADVLGVDDAKDKFRRMSTDQMGLGMIYYWSDLQCEDADDEG